MDNTPEQQIENTVNILKVLFARNAKDDKEAEEIIDRLDSIGHNAKALLAIVKDQNLLKAAIYKILLEMK